MEQQVNQNAENGMFLWYKNMTEGFVWTLKWIQNFPGSQFSSDPNELLQEL